MRAIILALTLPALASCAGYQFGDATRAAMSARAEYCTTTDPDRRALLLAVMHGLGIPTLSGGICTGFDSEDTQWGS